VATAAVSYAESAHAGRRIFLNFRQRLSLPFVWSIGNNARLENIMGTSNNSWRLPELVRKCVKTRVLSRKEDVFAIF